MPGPYRSSKIQPQRRHSSTLTRTTEEGAVEMACLVKLKRQQQEQLVAEKVEEEVRRTRQLHLASFEVSQSTRE